MTGGREGAAGAAGRVIWLLALLALVCWPAGGAHAQGDARPPERAESSEEALRIDVHRLDGIVPAGADVTLDGWVHHGGAQTVDDARVQAALHVATRTREDFQRAMETRDAERETLGDVVLRATQDLGDLEPGGSARLALTVPAIDLDLAAGVYPLRLSVVAGGQVRATTTTSVVVPPSEVTGPMGVSVLVPFAAPVPALGTSEALADDLGAAGALGGVVAEVRAARGLEIGLAVDALTARRVADVAALAAAPSDTVAPDDVAAQPVVRRADALTAALRAAASDPHVRLVRMPYGSADLVALQRAGLPGEVSRHVVDAAGWVEEVTGLQPPTAVVWPSDGLDEATLATVLATGADSVVLDAANLASARADTVAEDDLDHPLRPLLPAGSGATALVPDPVISEFLRAADEGPELAAQRIAGELAAAWFAQPDAPDRALLAGPSTPQQPLPQGLLTALSRRVEATDLFAPVSLDALREQPAAQGSPAEVTYPAQARIRELPEGYLEELLAARVTLGSLAAMLVADPDTPGAYDQLLLRAASVHHRGEKSPQGVALMEAVVNAADDVRAEVQVRPGAPVTLTAVEGELPVALRSDAQVPLRVRVHLLGARFQNLGPEEQLVDLPPGETVVVAFRVRATSPGGTSPVRIEVRDPEGLDVISSSTMVVRSTAASPLTIAAVGGAAAFLAVWWVRDTRRRRRAGGGRPRPHRRGPSSVARSSRALH